MKKALFIGRFQPFHKGHEWLFKQKLDKGIPLLIAIRDVIPDEKNPFTAIQSLEMIKKVMSNYDIEYMIIPDIESVNWGRGVGYETNEFKPPIEIKEISATKIRENIENGSDDWKKHIDSTIWNDILTILKQL